MDVNGWLRSHKSSSIFLLFGLAAFPPRVRLETFFFICMPLRSAANWRLNCQSDTSKKTLPFRTDMCWEKWLVAISSESKSFSQFIREQHPRAPLCRCRMPVASCLRESHWQFLYFRLAESTIWSNQAWWGGKKKFFFLIFKLKTRQEHFLFWEVLTKSTMSCSCLSHRQVSAEERSSERNDNNVSGSDYRVSPQFTKFGQDYEFVSKSASQLSGFLVNFWLWNRLLL